MVNVAFQMACAVAVREMLLAVLVSDFAAAAEDLACSHGDRRDLEAEEELAGFALH